MKKESEIFVILNPASGRGRGEKSHDLLAKALKGVGARFELVETLRPRHATELARAARLAGYGTVVAAGGDGTVSEVVNGLMLAESNGNPAGKLGVFPIGSGNDFATMAGVPIDIDKCARRLVHGRVRLVDVGSALIRGEASAAALKGVAPGEAGHRYFDNNLGVGLEAAVTLESYKIRRLRGTLLYVIAAIRAVLKFRAPHMTMDWRASSGASGDRNQRTLMVSVGNGPRTGGGFFVTPDAKLDDDFLDVAIADHISRPRALALLPRALKGTHTTDEAVTMLRVDRLRITVPSGAPLQLDGEVVAERATEVVIEILPRRLEVIV